MRSDHDSCVQAQALVKAKELMVHKLPEKMEHYFPSLLEFQTSTEAVVKQHVVEAVLECMEATPRLDFLAAATGCVRHLLNDAFPSVVKAALVGAKNLVLVSLHALCYAGPGDRPIAERQWRGARRCAGHSDRFTHQPQEQRRAHAGVQAPRASGAYDIGVALPKHQRCDLCLHHEELRATNHCTLGAFASCHVTLLLRAAYRLCVLLSGDGSHGACLPEIICHREIRAVGRFRTIPFSRCPYPDTKDLAAVSVKCRKTLTACCKPSSLRNMPATVQIVLLMSLAALATKRSEFAQEMVLALVQAADYFKTLGAYLNIAASAAARRDCRCFTALSLSLRVAAVQQRVSDTPL